MYLMILTSTIIYCFPNLLHIFCGQAVQSYGYYRAAPKARFPRCRKRVLRYSVLRTQIVVLWCCRTISPPVSLLKHCPDYISLLTTELSSIQRCPHCSSVLTTVFSSLQPFFNTTVSSTQMCPDYRIVLNTGVSWVRSHDTLLTTALSSILLCPEYSSVVTTALP